MANREELAIIRGARSGDAAAQLALGKLYLFGGASLPQNVPTALHWLCRAATQGVDDAWRLIGAHIPCEVAQGARAQALPWFERAAQESVPGAARVLARLQQAEPAPAAPPLQKPAGPPPVPPPCAAAGVPQAWRALEADPGADQNELMRLRTLAAQGGDRDAQLSLGLLLARMNSEGERLAPGSAAVNFKRALRWLAQAGEQGLADAWYAMSRIYIRPEFSQRSASEAHACLERIAPLPAPTGWADPLLPLLSHELLGSQPLLAARIELAAMFRLTRAEALLLDVKAADQGHCLVVDIRASYGRSKRRLVQVRTAAERHKLDRIVRLFEQVGMVEGNYRQRLYRLKSWAGGELMVAA